MDIYPPYAKQDYLTNYTKIYTICPSCSTEIPQCKHGVTSQCTNCDTKILVFGNFLYYWSGINIKQKKYIILKKIKDLEKEIKDLIF